MKQILQNLKSGELELAEVVAPRIRSGHLLIQTKCSLISSGTERMLLDFAKSGLIGKAKRQPDKVKQVIDKIKTDGLIPTIHSVFSRLDQPLPLGYCNCGTVLEVGDGVEGFEIGDRVASNGPHAEVVCVPKNLCTKVPDNVTDEQASFTVLASIGLQGIRLVKPEFGETAVVFGLGLIGLLSAQLLKGMGCSVIGIDLEPERLVLAEKYGIKTIDPSVDSVAAVAAFTNGKGADAILITASAKHDAIVHQAAQMSRKRGRIVLIGVVNLDLKRDDFYEKELSFQVSCSYGPGRYDPEYEQGGVDYPYGFVRWTEQRNFEAVLNAFSTGSLNVSKMISERIPIGEAAKAYQMLTEDSSKIALLLTYPCTSKPRSSIIEGSIKHTRTKPVSDVAVAVVGAGNFARMTLLPAIKPLGIRLKTVVDIEPVASFHAAKKFGFEQASNDFDKILADTDINLVFITTNHNMHADMVIRSLEAGKHVHVEKPLCLTVEELEKIRKVYSLHDDKILHTGFNRRFSCHALKIREVTRNRTAPMCMTWLVNAGYIPADVWLQDPKRGGGRIIGEGCHWLDFMLYLADAPITSVHTAIIGKAPGVEVRTDKVTISVTFADGSIGTLHYFANGSKSFPKETFYLFCDGKVIHLDNFRRLRGYGFPSMKTITQQKGHKQQFEQLITAVRTGTGQLVPFENQANITLATFAAMESAASKKVVQI